MPPLNEEGVRAGALARTPDAGAEPGRPVDAARPSPPPGAAAGVPRAPRAGAGVGAVLVSRPL